MDKREEIQNLRDNILDWMERLVRIATQESINLFEYNPTTRKLIIHIPRNYHGMDITIKYSED